MPKNAENLIKFIHNDSIYKKEIAIFDIFVKVAIKSSSSFIYKKEIASFDIFVKLAIKSNLNASWLVNRDR